MLKVKNLKVNYGHISALNGISFEVPDNSIVSLMQLPSVKRYPESATIQISAWAH